ncbi:hypothetical protein FHX48_000639 [Microbacterium halimionae]|uniref:Uncharacterized protein n=1 Tax=Microbacterium halimionae TaxID=1526413 RepID=A0A7W3JMJ3_9MICO|nr:hypothetical protein [Microbacterium halimionae]MBA8815587.1 hypothetical protein [Microbacterium halimionae]NII95633.1 hypothetical protein [Microbacterium halimionae]
MSDSAVGIAGFLGLTWAAIFFGICGVLLVIARPAAFWFAQFMEKSPLLLPMERSKKAAIKKSTPARLRAQLAVGLPVAVIVLFNLAALLRRNGTFPESLSIPLSVLATLLGILVALAAVLMIAARTTLLPVTPSQKARRARYALAAIVCALIVLGAGVLLLLLPSS